MCLEVSSEEKEKASWEDQNVELKEKGRGGEDFFTSTKKGSSWSYSLGTERGGPFSFVFLRVRGEKEKREKKGPRPIVRTTSWKKKKRGKREIVPKEKRRKGFTF